MKSKIIPTVFATNKRDFKEKFSKLSRVSDSLQIDFMDGKFVNNTSIGVSDIPRVKNYEAHLMVYNPGKWLDKLKKKNFKKIIFHYESFKTDRMIREFISKAKSFRFDVFIAINPETKVKDILGFIKEVDGILIMGVHPGRERQKLIRKTYSKIKKIRKLNKEIPIQIDGGVNPKTASKLINAGATILNSGSFISKAENPRRAIERLRV